uniref:Uncharacterized protein n=1 Tax=Strigamia maritima TaxID=126957 RepID=T1ISL0_STRMM
MEYQNSKMEYQNSKMEYQNSKMEYQNSKMEYQNSKMEYQNSEIEVRCITYVTVCHVLMVLIIINLALTMWIVKVMDFSVEGMGKLKILDKGLRLEGEAEFVHTFYTTNIKGKKGKAGVLDPIDGCIIAGDRVWPGVKKGRRLEQLLAAIEQWNAADYCTYP